MESPKKHRRNVSAKATRPRQSTKGPLDAPDEIPKASTGTTSGVSSPTSEIDSSRSPREPFNMFKDSTLSSKDNNTIPVKTDFSFLLRPEIFHPLSQLEIPQPFRSEFPSLTPGDSLESSLCTLDGLLKHGHFLLAAQFSATILTSKLISPGDYSEIFSLLYTRLACLELTGNTLLASQEAKSLEDLNSAFYYPDTGVNVPGDSADRKDHGRPPSIVPWPLQIIVVRLQSIGFGDARRGITGFYELGLEARKQIARPEIGHQEKALWQERLADLGIRVVNALIEMGDLDAARRSLASMKYPSGQDQRGISRMALLNLKIGDIDAARKLLTDSSQLSEGMFSPLLDMVEGRYEDAASGWKTLQETYKGKSDEALITQNLAVCLLYMGKQHESRGILESLAASNNSFKSLTFNLATIYELCSEDSRTLKLELAEKISNHQQSEHDNWERPNADFKI